MPEGNIWNGLITIRDGCMVLLWQVLLSSLNVFSLQVSHTSREFSSLHVSQLVSQTTNIRERTDHTHYRAFFL